MLKTVTLSEEDLSKPWPSSRIDKHIRHPGFFDTLKKDKANLKKYQRFEECVVTDYTDLIDHALKEVLSKIIVLDIMKTSDSQHESNIPNALKIYSNVYSQLSHIILKDIFRHKHFEKIVSATRRWMQVVDALLARKNYDGFFLVLGMVDKVLQNALILNAMPAHFIQCYEKWNELADLSHNKGNFKKYYHDNKSNDAVYPPGFIIGDWIRFKENFKSKLSISDGNNDEKGSRGKRSLFKAPDSMELNDNLTKEDIAIIGRIFQPMSNFPQLKAKPLAPHLLKMMLKAISSEEIEALIERFYELKKNRKAPLMIYHKGAGTFFQSFKETIHVKTTFEKIFPLSSK
jgi:hypothetical protein